MLLAIHFAIVVLWCLPINLNTKYGWDENTNIFLTGAKECKQTIVQSCVCVLEKNVRMWSDSYLCQIQE